MKEIALGLSQLIAIAWVWQQEVFPVFFSVLDANGSKCGVNLRPDKHVKAYNSLLDKILSDKKELKYDKGAFNMFMQMAAQMSDFAPFSPQYKQFFPNRISAEKQLMKPTEEDLVDARSIIRTMRSVDSMGNPLFKLSPSKLIMRKKK